MIRIDAKKAALAVAALFIGMIAVESGFEDRQGSGNITEIQQTAAREQGELSPAKGEIPEWFSPDGESGELASAGDTPLEIRPQATGPAIREAAASAAALSDPAALLGSGGALIPAPQPDLIERSPPSA